MTAALDGRVAVVTGGGSGIGQEVCSQLAAAGASVTVADLDEASASATAAEIVTGEHAVVDVTRPADVDAAFDAVVAKHGRLDICCNVAGLDASVEWKQ